MKRRQRTFLITICIILVLGAWPGYRYYRLVQLENAIDKSSEKVAMALYSRMNTTGGVWWECEYSWEQDNLEQYIADGYLDEIPFNPLTGEPLRLIQPSESPHPGDMLLLPVKMLVKSEISDQYYDDANLPGYPGFGITEDDCMFYLMTFGIRMGECHVSTECVDIDGDGRTDPFISSFSPGMRSGKATRLPEPFVLALERSGYPVIEQQYSTWHHKVLPTIRYLIGIEPVD